MTDLAAVVVLVAATVITIIAGTHSRHDRHRY